jgi:hypothetical protein
MGPDGKVVAAGPAQAATTNTNFGVARYLGG